MAPREANREEYIPAFGIHCDNTHVHVSQEDAKIGDAVRTTAKVTQPSQTTTLFWPTIGTKALSEYDKTIKIFAMAFFWLFPGGIGDINDHREIEVSLGSWIHHLLLYYDGRFANDKMFPFYAFNYLTRHRNKTQSNFLIKGFVDESSMSVSEVKRRISEEGNLKILNQICYSTKLVSGSSGYYRFHKSHLSAWINHHIDFGNGPPNFFITLSCAEYYWPDLIRVVNERIKIRDGVMGTLAVDKPGIIKAMTDWTGVVQEFFQIRVQEWLDTVGKDVFEIESYWIRYEFAPSRGQIHAHMLAISKDKAFLEGVHEYRHNPKRRAQFAAEYASKKWGITASLKVKTVDGSEVVDQEVKTFDRDDHPAGKRYSDVKDKELDAEDMLHAVQMHNCNGYCMRMDKKEKCRVCRFGAGPEVTKDMCDTSGFSLHSEPTIDKQGGKTALQMPRNHSRLLQSSVVAAQSWRANQDVSVIMYKSDPNEPDVQEIARMTEYIVSYACKGNATHKEEVQMSKALIQNYVETTDDKNDVSRMVSQIINKISSSRLIPLQEVMVILTGLKLIHCSEVFDDVSLYTTKISSKKTPGQTSSNIKNQYIRREQKYEDYSFFEFFHLKKNCLDRGQLKNWRQVFHGKRGRKKIMHILHLNGGSTRVTYPVETDYAKTMLALHKPWRRLDDIMTRDVKGRFYELMKEMKNKQLGTQVQYDLAMYDYYAGYQRRPEVTAAPMQTHPENMSEEDRNIELLTGSTGNVKDSTVEHDSLSLDFGLNFEWDKEPPLLDVSLTIDVIFIFICHETQQKFYLQKGNIMVVQKD